MLNSGKSGDEKSRMSSAWLSEGKYREEKRDSKSWAEEASRI